MKNEKTPSDKGFFAHYFWTSYHFLRTYIIGFSWLGQQVLSSHKQLKEIPQRSGEIAIVTGGARGIGAEVAKQLLIADMNVIIACRDTTAGNGMVKGFRNGGVTSGTAEVVHLNLESFKSVRSFAKAFLQRGDPLHILVNNAGCWIPHKMTEDGYEAAFQVNYLSHFLLSLLLLPALISGGQEKPGRYSRIVHVSSKLSLLGRLNLDDLPMRKYYNRNLAYCNTKLCQVNSSNYMDKRFKKEKLPVQSFAVHPGIVNTGLFVRSHLYLILKICQPNLAWTPEQGADPVVYTALSEELEGQGGKMIGNCVFMTPNPQGIDPLVQVRLWNESCKMTGLEFTKQLSSIVPDHAILADVE